MLEILLSKKAALLSLSYNEFAAHMNGSKSDISLVLIRLSDGLYLISRSNAACSSGMLSVRLRSSISHTTNGMPPFRI